MGHLKDELSETASTAMRSNIGTSASPQLDNIFSDVPHDVVGQISPDQTLELIRLTAKVLLNGIDEVMDDASTSSLRADLERYSRKVAFSAATVCAKLAENRSRAAAQRQTLLVKILVNGDEEQTAERDSGLFPLGQPVRVIGIVPRLDEAELLVHEVARALDRHRVTVCAAVHGRVVLAVLPAAAGGALDHRVQALASGQILVSLEICW